MRRRGGGEAGTWGGEEAGRRHHAAPTTPAAAAAGIRYSLLHVVVAEPQETLTRAVVLHSVECVMTFGSLAAAASSAASGRRCRMGSCLAVSVGSVTVR